MSARPPALARAIYLRCAPVADAAFMAGDLDEEFEALVESDGLRAARVWYVRQVVTSLPHLLILRLREARPRRSPLPAEHVMHIASDARLAVRLARRQPVATLAVVLTIALTTGAATAVYGLLYGLVLRPLPFAEPERLVWIYTSDARLPDYARGTSSPADILDWREQSRAFSGIAAWNQYEATVGAGDAPQRVRIATVSHDIQAVLGVTPTAGRFFSAEEFLPGNRVAMLEHGFWLSAYGGDPTIVGSDMMINDRPYRVVGVLPPFGMPFPVRGAAVWTPLPMEAAAVEDQRGGQFLRVLARLAPGVGAAQAGADLEVVRARLAQTHAATNGDRTYWLEPMLTGLVAPLRPMLWMLGGATVLVLLIACANIGNIMLVRAEERRQEFAIRAAMGGSARRIAGQLVVEVLILASLGGVLGFVLAPVLNGLLVRLYPGGWPREGAIGMDVRVLLVALGIALIAGLSTSLPVLMRVWRQRFTGDLREGPRSGMTRARRRTAEGIVATQVAFAAVLLVAGALLLRSLWAVAARDPGFDTRGLIAFSMAPTGLRYPSEAEYLQFFEQVRARLGSDPGVRSVGWTTLLPYDEGNLEDGMWMDGIAQTRDNLVFPFVQGISPGYLETLGLRRVAGRYIDERDDAGAARVAVINTVMAERMFGGNAIGRRIITSRGPVEIVGVAESKRHRNLREEPRMEVYLPRSQTWFYTRAHWFLVRTAGDPAGLAPRLRDILREVDPLTAVAHLSPMQERIRRSLDPERFRGLLVGGLGTLGLLLTIVGIWGTVAFRVARQTREIGIRIALGEAPARVRRSVMSRALRVTAVGVAVGVGAGWLIDDALARFLFGVRAHDPLTFGAVAALMAVVTLLAAWAPASRAARVDPLTAIRGDRA